jgi:hypothetical protein
MICHYPARRAPPAYALMDEDLLAPVELDRPDAGTAIPPTMKAAAQRELERARRAEAARVAALVQYMLHGRGDGPRTDVTRH